MNKYIFCSILSFLFCQRICAEVITLNDYLQLLKKNDPDFKVLKINDDINKYYIENNLNSSLFTIELDKEIGRGTNDSETDSLTTTLSQTLLSTGSELSLSNTISNESDREEEIIEFRLEQSLFKNFLGKMYSLERDKITINKSINDLDNEERLEEFFVNKIKLYVNFADAAQEMIIAKELVDETKNLEKYVRSKLKNNAANKTDLKRIQLQVILREEDYLKKQAHFESMRVSVGSFIGLEALDFFPEKNIVINDFFPAHNISFDHTRFREYQIANKKIEALQLDKTLSIRELYPELNLILGYDIDRSTRFSTKVDTEETVIGLNFSMSFGDSSNKASKEIASLKLIQSEGVKKVLKRRLELGFRDHQQQMSKIKKRLELSNKKVQLAKDILDDDTRRYRTGKINLDKIIELNNNFVQYKLDYNINRTEFNKSYIDWLNFNDVLLSKIIRR